MGPWNQKWGIGNNYWALRPTLVPWNPQWCLGTNYGDLATTVGPLDHFGPALETWENTAGPLDQLCVLGPWDPLSGRGTHYEALGPTVDGEAVAPRPGSHLTLGRLSPTNILLHSSKALTYNLSNCPE